MAWVVILAAVFLIGVTKSGFGSGVGLMIVPITAIAFAFLPYGSEAALGFLLPLLICGDFIAVYQYRRLFSMAIVRYLLPGTLVGVILGGLLLWWFHEHERLVGALIRIEVGIESVLLVSLHWWRQWRGMQQRLMPEPWRSHLTGCFAAVSSTLAHAAGPIIAMYLLPLKLDRQLFVGTTALYFFLLNTAKLPAYFSAGLFHAAPWSFSVQFVPLVLAGAVFGFWINKHISDRLFMKVVYILTFILGWYLLVDGIVHLFRALR